MRIAWITTLLIIAGACCPVTFADGQSRTVETVDGFAITVPDDWLDMTDEMLEMFNQSSSASTCKYGFLSAPDLSNAEGVIVIKINKDGRMKESELQDMDKLTRDIRKGIRQSMPPDGTFTVEPVTYNADTHLLLYTASMTMQDINVTTISGMYLTETGSIEVYCTTSPEYLQAMEPVFMDIVHSVRIDANLKYKHGRSNTMAYQLGELTFDIFIVCIIFLVVWALVRRKGKSPAAVASTTSPPPIPPEPTTPNPGQAPATSPPPLRPETNHDNPYNQQ